MILETPMLWVRSANHIDVVAIPLPGDIGGLVGSEFGTFVIGACGRRAERGKSFPVGFSTDRSDHRYWLQPGLIQWGLLSGDNESDTELGFAGFTIVLASEPTPNGSVTIPYW